MMPAMLVRGSPTYLPCTVLQACVVLNSMGLRIPRRFHSPRLVNEANLRAAFHAYCAKYNKVRGTALLCCCTAGPSCQIRM